MPSASGGGGAHIDNPTQSGELVGVLGDAVALVGALGDTVVLVAAGGFVELGPDAFGCDAHAATTTHPIATTAIDRIALDINVLSSHAGRSESNEDYCAARCPKVEATLMEDDIVLTGKTAFEWPRNEH